MPPGRGAGASLGCRPVPALVIGAFWIAGMSMSLLDVLDACAAYIAATPLRLVGYFGPTEKSPILGHSPLLPFPILCLFHSLPWQEMAAPPLRGPSPRRGTGKENEGRMGSLGFKPTHLIKPLVVLTVVRAAPIWLAWHSTWVQESRYAS